jgi:hypothetical protein
MSESSVLTSNNPCTVADISVNLARRPATVGCAYRRDVVEPQLSSKSDAQEVIITEPIEADFCRGVLVLQQAFGTGQRVRVRASEEIEAARVDKRPAEEVLPSGEWRSDASARTSIISMS